MEKFGLYPVSVGVVVLSILLLMTGSAMAAVTITGETTYEGLKGDSQAITVEATVAPEEADIVNATIRATGTSQTFLDADSFETTISPGDADIQVEPAGAGEFEIDRIGVGEEVTFVFDVYPRTIKEESVLAAQVTVEYTQNGQALSDQRTFDADMTNSSYFAYQNTGTWQDAVGWINAVGYVAIVVVVVGAAVLAWKRRKEGGTY